ncbi:MAG: SAM-dependent methyltransferase [Nocardioidaceae bacterium]|nr:SAM-dependent methyltransferase [Nocardioidaceae bacterium]
MSDAEAMDDEFDTVARWTAEAVTELGDAYAVPAACQGSGSPAALEWLGAAMGLTAGRTLLDVGAGLGGPAVLVARELGVRTVSAEPSVGACRASRTLFAAAVVSADGASLPFADGSVDAAWSLGVLCTLDDKSPSVAELARVVAPGGRVGLLVFVRTVDELPVQPEGNSFPTGAEVTELLTRHGLTLTDHATLDDFAAPPPDWQAAEDRVQDVVEREHRGDERWQRAQEQQEVMGRLIGDELVVGHLYVCRVDDPS